VFTVVYRWRIKPAYEAKFLAAWHSRTERIYRERGSYGSRLHREPGGIYCAIALWPSEEAWKATEPALLDDETDAEVFATSIQEQFPTITMESIDDLWRLPT
jgi:heme-degrading monooxygenase HmoA